MNYHTLINAKIKTHIISEHDDQPHYPDWLIFYGFTNILEDTRRQSVVTIWSKITPTPFPHETTYIHDCGLGSRSSMFKAEPKKALCFQIWGTQTCKLSKYEMEEEYGGCGKVTPTRTHPKILMIARKKITEQWEKCWKLFSINCCRFFLWNPLTMGF